METLPGLDLSTNELRFVLLDYHDYIVATIEDATRHMASLQTDRQEKLNTVVWRSNLVSAAQEFAFEADPLAGLTEMYVLSRRQLTYFESPAAEQLFGPPHTLAVEAARSIHQRARDLAYYITDVADLETRLARLDSVAAADPLGDLAFFEGSGLNLPESFVPEAAGGLATLGSIEQTTRDLSDRVNVYYRYLPRQLRWEMERVALIAYEEYGEELSADISGISSALSSLDQRVATITDSLVAEIQAFAAESVARERSTILTEIDRERLATIDALRAELQLVLADVERQRTETLRSMADLVAATQTAVVADLGSAIDGVLDRVTMLLAGLGAAAFVALGLLILLFNRTRPDARAG